MKATGIVRRIDELGRVVIPKEIRSTLRLKSGDPILTTLKDFKPKKKHDFLVKMGNFELNYEGGRQIEVVDNTQIYILAMESLFLRLNIKQ